MVFSVLAGAGENPPPGGPSGSRTSSSSPRSPEPPELPCETKLTKLTELSERTELAEVPQHANLTDAPSLTKFEALYLSFLDQGLSSGAVTEQDLARLCASGEPVSPVESNKLAKFMSLRRAFAGAVPRLNNDGWIRLKRYINERVESLELQRETKEKGEAQTRHITGFIPLGAPLSGAIRGYAADAFFSSVGDFYYSEIVEDQIRIVNFTTGKTISIPAVMGAAGTTALFEDSRGRLLLAFISESVLKIYDFQTQTQKQTPVQTQTPVHIQAQTTIQIQTQTQTLTPQPLQSWDLAETPEMLEVERFNLTAKRSPRYRPVFYEFRGRVHVALTPRAGVAVYLKKPEDPKVQVVPVFDFDLLNRKLKVTELPKGVWSYERDVDGQLFAFGLGEFNRREKVSPVLIQNLSDSRRKPVYVGVPMRDVAVIGLRRDARGRTGLVMVDELLYRAQVDAVFVDGQGRLESPPFQVPLDTGGHSRNYPLSASLARGFAGPQALVSTGETTAMLGGTRDVFQVHVVDLTERSVTTLEVPAGYRWSLLDRVVRDPKTGGWTGVFLTKSGEVSFASLYFTVR